MPWWAIQQGVQRAADPNEPSRFPELQTVTRPRTLLGPILTEAEMRKCTHFALIAITLAVAATAVTFGSAGRAEAEPPNPCHYGFCEE
jgi:hypothetical protein